MKNLIILMMLLSCSFIYGETEEECPTLAQMAESDDVLHPIRHKKAFEDNSPQAQCNLAYLYYERGDYCEAARLIQLADDNGYVDRLERTCKQVMLSRHIISIWSR